MIDPKAKILFEKWWKELGLQLEMLESIVQTSSEQKYRVTKQHNEMLSESNMSHGIIIKKVDQLKKRLHEKSKQLEELMGEEPEY